MLNLTSREQVVSPNRIARTARYLPPKTSLSGLKLRRAATLVLALTLCLETTAGAGLTGGRIEGYVTDPAGARVAGAQVLLRNAAGVLRQTRTDSAGQYVLADVEEGAYTLIILANGFAQEERPTIDVRTGVSQTVAVRLRIAAVSDSIVVSAARTETLAAEAAGSVSVVAGNEFTRRGQWFVLEALRNMPGLSVAQSGGRGAITSVFARGGESDYNKVLVDGVPVNAAGGLFDFGGLATENLDRVEVVRGPGSALFGSDAMTSVIQLVTRRGSTSTPEFELSGEGGSFQSYRETALLSGLAGRFDYSSSFSFQRTDGRFQNSDYLSRSASANLGFRLSPGTDFRLVTRLNNNTLGVPGPTAVLFSDPDQRQKHRDIALAGSLDLRSSSRWRQTARFVYSEADTTNFDPAAQDLTQPGTPRLAPGTFGPDFAFTFRDHQKRAGFHYQSIAAVGTSHVISAGLDFERESADTTSDFSRSSPARNNLGLYVQDQAFWRERLFLTAGVRLEHNSGSVPDDFVQALRSLDSDAPVGDVGFGYWANPRIAVSVLARSHRDSGLGATRVRASLGTGIKAPRLDEAFSPSPFFLGNPALDPERATSFDLGVVQGLAGGRAEFELTYFDNRFRDLIVFRFDPATFGPIRLPDGRLASFINLDRASARGLELAAAARPLSKLHVSAGYTFVRSRVEESGERTDPEVGLWLLRRPRNSGSAQVSWIDERFDVTVDGSFVGRRRDVDPISGLRFDASGKPIFNNSYAKVSTAASYRAGRIVAFARVENVLNDDYEEVLGFPAYRINFRAGLRVRIGGSR